MTDVIRSTVGWGKRGDRREQLALWGANNRLQHQAVKQDRTSDCPWCEQRVATYELERSIWGLCGDCENDIIGEVLP